jgi:hypothetical protein
VSSLRGCYLSSNVTYNVKKMVKNGDLTQQRSLNDGRVIRIGLTEKGIRLRDRLTTMHQRHAEMLPQAGLSATALQGANGCATSSASGSELAISCNGRRNSPPEFCWRPSSVRTLATKCRRSIWPTHSRCSDDRAMDCI